MRVFQLVGVVLCVGCIADRDPQPDHGPDAAPQPEPAEPEPPAEPTCASTCARVADCFEPVCERPLPADFEAECRQFCAGNDSLIAWVDPQETCEAVVGILRSIQAVEIDFIAACDAEPPPPANSCEGVCAEVVACFESGCGPQRAALGADCIASCYDDPALIAVVRSQDACVDVVDVLLSLQAPFVEGACAPDPEPAPRPEPEPEPGDDCAMACDTITACCRRPVPADFVAQCQRMCFSNGARAILPNAQWPCDRVMSHLGAAFGLRCPAADSGCAPPDRGCAAACRRFDFCLERECNAEQGALFGVCLEACDHSAEMITLLDAEAETCRAVVDLVPSVFGGEFCGPPDPMETEADRACRLACDFILDCDAPDLSFEQRQPAFAACHESCLSESTPEERACINGLNACRDLETCFEP